METPDVADDLDRLFPAAGAAIEETGIVTTGRIGDAPSRLVDFAALVGFGSQWISRQNALSGTTT